MPASTTISTTAMENALRARILAFADPSGATVGDTIAERVYIDTAPAGTAFPYAVMRWLPNRSDGAYSGDRLTGDLEVVVYARGDIDRDEVKLVGDLVQQAFLRYRHNDASEGLMFSRERVRQQLPAFDAAPDHQLSGERHLIGLVVWPQYLLQHSDS